MHTTTRLLSIAGAATMAVALTACGSVDPYGSNNYPGPSASSYPATSYPAPAGSYNQQAAGVDLGRHVGDHELDRLVHRDRHAELHALLGVLGGELERGARDAGRHGGDARSQE